MKITAEQDIQEIDSLISQLIGSSVSSNPPEETPAPTHTPMQESSSSEVYSIPVKVGREGKEISKGDKPWIVGTFLPNQYVNETHPQGHMGQDQKAPKGTPVYPIASGTVIEVKQYSKGGNTCKVAHENGGVVSYYAHMDTVNVSPGTKVSSSSILGTVGDTGNAKGRGAHLHYEVAVDGKKVDPSSVIGKRVGSLSQKYKLAQILVTLDKHINRRLDQISKTAYLKVVEQFLEGKNCPLTGQEIILEAGENFSAATVKILGQELSKRAMDKEEVRQLIRQASDFKVPEHFLQAVRDKIEQGFAAQIRFNTEQLKLNAMGHLQNMITLQQNAKLKSKSDPDYEPDDTNYPQVIKMDKDNIKEFDKIIQFCKKITPAKSRSKESSIRFFFDLKDIFHDAPYLTLEEKNNAAHILKKNKWPNKILVILYFKHGSEFWGLWYPNMKKIDLFSPPEYENYSDFENAFNLLHNTIRHEIQHMMQDALTHIKQLNQIAGIPSAKIRWTDTHTPEGEPLQSHHEKLEDNELDVEFYPRLKDSIEDFKRNAKYESNPKAFFKFWIGLDDTYEPDNQELSLEPNEFFMALKNHDHLKWQKAVRELWKSF